MREMISMFLRENIGDRYLPEIRIVDIVEILLIAFAVYQIMLWIKNTKAWMLLKGFVVIGIFILGAAVFRMHTILWLARNSISILATAAVVIFQPELRRALEKLGEKNILTSVVTFDKKKEGIRFHEETIEYIVAAVFEMSEVKTGALIVVEKAIKLTEYESTGITLDCLVSKQILLNIFEHNTPLHDGAVIIRGNRIVSATCYLPLSDNMRLSKELGTRHRAAIGMSEVSDALIISVSEENGYVSVAQGGQLFRNISKEELESYLYEIQLKYAELGKSKRTKKGERKNDEKTEK